MHMGCGKNAREWLAVCFCWYPGSYTNYVNYTSFIFCSLYWILDSIPELGVGLWFYCRFYLSEDFVFLSFTINFPVASLGWWVKIFLVTFSWWVQPFMRQGSCFQLLASGLCKSRAPPCLCAKMETLTPNPYIHVQCPSWLFWCAFCRLSRL